jgi:MYXO-CTERM domain-containing protein
MPVARCVLGERHELTLKMRTVHALALCEDPAATLDDLREAVTTLKDSERIARRVLGGAHPDTKDIEDSLRTARAALAARETSARVEEAPARVEEALARVDRLERELVESTAKATLESCADGGPCPWIKKEDAPPPPAPEPNDRPYLLYAAVAVAAVAAIALVRRRR